ncbi:MAG: class I SAM-dependent methyltransferase [Pseudomonadota bacterium]
MNAITLKPERDKSLRRRHPWIFSGAVARVSGKPKVGETIAVYSARNEFLASAAYNPHSQIVARVWSWGEEAIDAEFFRRRLARALTQRAALPTLCGLESVRLVHGESDGLPGLVVDRYRDTLVMQAHSAGAQQWKGVIADLLLELAGAAHIYERSDADVMELEGLPPISGVLRNAPPQHIDISEHGVSYRIDIARGHKTGFYLDQRDNRARVAQYAAGKTMLNCFCYSGGFTLAALAAGAQAVVSVDASAAALALARDNMQLNDFPQERAEWLEGDVFQVLRGYRDTGRRFDVIVLDPPKFAPTPASAERAARGYKDINWLAFKLLNPGGVLATFSCSGGINADLFQKIVAGAALDADVDAQIVERLHAAADHPVALNFPEGEYLKGLICRVAG